MAGFKMHVTTSTVVGIGYGVAAHGLFDVPIPTCALAAGLCSVSGMMPDFDSESGTPVREGSAFAAAIVPMLMMDRFQAMGWANETIALAAAGIYVVVRFALPYLLGTAAALDPLGRWTAAAAGISAVGVAVGPGVAGLMVSDSSYSALGGFVIACGLGAGVLILPVARAVDRF